MIARPLFVATLAAVDGLLSGYFAARALTLVMTARAARANDTWTATPDTSPAAR
ncbi:MAG TPA: hypothetical protein VEA40_15385 [Ramlibacter sp.]|nr:hypothetical protein [Ramlibacter sp.]